MLFLFALAMFACGQKEDNQKQTEEKKVVIPPGMPVAPTQQMLQAQNQGDPTAPVLNMEEGKPLDLGQLMGGQKKSIGEQATAQIDTIRLKAGQGDADYEYLYAACFENGWGVEKDLPQALTWYKKAANHEQKSAYNAIGNFYRLGWSVKQDDNEAFKWFKKGVEASDAQAMLNLGNCYYFGMGTEKNVDKAVELWQQAADNDNAFALAQMGDCYFYGIGVEKDMDKAVEYLTQASDRNVEGAQYRLGLLYYAGQGVKQDLSYSELLMKKARDGGMKEAQDFLDKHFK